MQRVPLATARSAEALAADVDALDILALNLTRDDQPCVDAAVPVLAGSEQPALATMRAAFELLARERRIPEDLAIRMRAAVSFPNLAVHAHHRIDWAIVHRLTQDGIETLRAFAGCLDRPLS